MTKQSHLSLALIATLLAGCATRESSEMPIHGDFPSAEEVHAVDIGECPFGHEKLKDVPIEYGLPNDDDELDRQLENHEVWLGGCCVGPWSPTNKVLCVECLYHYVNFMESWEKKSKTPSDFNIALDGFISNWPRFRDDDHTFFQRINTDEAITHEILVWSSHSLKAADALIAPYLENQTLPLTRSMEKSWRWKEIQYHAESDDCSYNITIEHDKSDHATFIRASKAIYARPNDTRGKTTFSTKQ